jgi:hypothetical protein
MMFSCEQKLGCALRELHYRKHVYKRWVEAGKMSEINAKREIALMEEIAADYQAQMKAGELPLNGAA